MRLIAIVRSRRAGTHKLLHVCKGALRLAAAALIGSAAAAAPASEPTYAYATQSSDTVIGISRRLLADPQAWPEVARFNGLKNPNRIATRSVLRIPLRLMRSEVAAAQVEQVVGEVRSGRGAAALPLRGGEALTEGVQVQTGRDGFAVLRLADGSLLRLAANSQLQIDQARRYPAAGHVNSGVKLDSGRVDVQAAKAVAGKPGFEVRTPQGVLGVRGTVFRVSAGQASSGEVLEGAVAFAGASGDAGARQLAAGFGTVIDAQGKVEEPTRLLPAPDLAAMPRLQERLVLRFALPALAGAKSFRGQIARDAQMKEVVADNLAEGSELRFTNLDDGDYTLQVRAIDARGLEGLNSSLAFKLKARPEPPLPSAPAPRGVTRGSQVELSWAANPEAVHYHLQVATDERFTRDLRDLPAVAVTTQVLDQLAPGDYFWRLASVRAGKDQGPWGSARGFVMRAPPATPAPPAIGASAMKFAWEGEPGQTFEFQLANDDKFTKLVQERKLDKPELELPRPPGGVYFMRLRARDADGFQGPFTTPQRFEIIDCMKSSDGNCVNSSAGTPLRLP
jgi:hypothetical protein